MKKTVTILFFSAFIISCNSSRIYEKFLKIEDSVWKTDDIKTFDVTIADTGKLYQVFFNIRNSTKYEFSNLWVFITIEAPNGQIKADTFEIILANDLGEWKGSGLGNINSVEQQYFKHPVKFPQSGIYNFRVQQAMRREELKEITDIGLRIESY